MKKTAGLVRTLLSAGLLVLLLCISTVPCTVTARAFSAETGLSSARRVQMKQAVKKGLIKEKGKYYYYEKGKKVRNTWKNVRLSNGQTRRYYFMSSGAACTSSVKWHGYYYVFNKKGMLRTGNGNRLFQAGNHLYCPGPDGRCVTQKWLNIEGKLYYATKKAYMAVNKTYGTIEIRNTRAVDSASVRSKLDAVKVVSSITSDGMSKGEKLWACWNYMIDQSRFQYVLRYDPDRSDPEWTKRKAYEMLESEGGDCISFACAFASLAEAVGYRPVVIYGRVKGTRDQAADGFTTHCWVKIDGKYYDTEAHFAGWLLNVFGNSVYDYPYQILNTYDYISGRVLS